MIVAVMTTALAGTVKAETVTYTVSSKTAVTTSGTAPTGSSVSFSSTGNTAEQLTAGTYQVLTLSGYSGCTITGLKLNMKSNSSKGAGALFYSTDGGSTYTYLVGSDGSDGTSVNGIAFSDANWYGSWSTSFVDITKAVTINASSSNIIIKIRATQNSLYCHSYTLTYTPASSAVATTTTIDASGITNTDVYTNTAAGSLVATVKAGTSTISGATVTWSGDNDNVATINASTGAVTLVGAGTVTFTASYAGVSGEYQPSSATYELTVTDSTPFIGSIFIFNTDAGLTELGITKPGSGAGTELDTNEDYSIGNVTMNITHGGTNTRVWNSNGTTDLRVYNGGSLTFTVPAGNAITKVTFAGSTIGLNNQTNGVWTASGDPVNTITFTNGSTGSKINTITVEYEANTTPMISAENVNIDYSATSGNISYSITNPVAGTSLTASTDATWITLGTITSEAVPFTCSANEVTESRTATVTLTYGEVTKEVAVTQAAAPVIYTTIPALFEAATSTETEVNINFGGWVVSGVSGKNAYLTDNQGHGLIIYTDGHGFAVNDVLTGTVSCKLQLFRGSAELTNLTSSTTGLSVAQNGTVTSQTIAISELSGVNTGALLSFEGLTYNGTALVDGNNNTITPYSTLYAGTFVDGKTYNIKGIFQQYGSIKEILPRSAADIEEVVSTTPSIVVDPDEVSEDAEEHEGTLDVTYENLTITDMSDFGIQFYDADNNELNGDDAPDWIEILVAEAEGGTSYVVSYYMLDNDGAARTAYFKVFATGDEDFVYSNLVTVTQAAASVTPPTPAGSKYVKVTSTDDLTDGQYLIVYETDGVAFNGGLGTLDAGNNVISVAICNGEIAATEATAAAEFTIDVTEGTILSASGEYIGVSSNNNGLKQTEDASAYTNSFSIDDDGNAVISAVFERSTMSLRFNSASGDSNYRFRYYKNAGQQAIQLYKFVEATTPEPYAPESITLNAQGYATFASTSAVNLDETADCTAWAITAIEGTSITFTQVEGVVAAGTGLLLKGAPGATINPEYSTSTGSSVADNLLEAIVTPTDIVADQYYGLSGKTFVKVNAGQVPAGKALLPASALTTGVKTLTFNFDEDATAIKAIDNGQLTTDGVIYNVAGQRLSKMQKGINIVNGRKVLY